MRLVTWPYNPNYLAWLLSLVGEHSRKLYPAPFGSGWITKTLTDQSKCPPDVVTLKSQCVQLVPSTGIDSMLGNF